MAKFTARVADIREARRDSRGVLWEIALDSAVLMPGQQGMLVARASSGAELRVEVEEIMQDAEGTRWHRTRKPLMVGTVVEGQA